MGDRRTIWVGGAGGKPENWGGGRYYLDGDGNPVFLIEAMRGGKRYSIKLRTHDKKRALAEFARFNEDPEAYVRPPVKPVSASTDPVFITEALVSEYLAYLERVKNAVKDYRAAKASYLADWADLGVDLRTMDKAALRVALASFDGGHKGRLEALNTFANWLVKDKEGKVLASWPKFDLPAEFAPKATRAERAAYTVEELQAAYANLQTQPLRDLFRLRIMTGMHSTEIDQLEECKVSPRPLPEKGVAIRTLDGKHEIAGVLQVMHKSRRYR